MLQSNKNKKQINKKYKKKLGGNGENKSTNLRKTRRHSTTKTNNKNKNNNLLMREINETDEMYRGRLEFIKLNQMKATNNKNNKTSNNNKKSQPSLEDIIMYSKIWLYKTFYLCSYAHDIEKKLQSFVMPKILLNH